jgi:beta-glucosidase
MLKNMIVSVLMLSVWVADVTLAASYEKAEPLILSNEKSMTAFINKLMAKMTLEEKIGQLNQLSAEMDVTGPKPMKPEFKSEISHGLVGSIFNAYTPKFARELQSLALKSRLKIPLLIGYDVIHGHRTIFPIPLGESASWNIELIKKSAQIAAEEASADGIHWTFAPMVDIARDPRWGRVSEGAGEDPWLGSKIAAARVQGFQGKDYQQSGTVLSSIKHLAAYGAPIGGRDYNAVDMSERELLTTYLPPYEAGVKAGAATVMASFNEISGIPSSANQWLLTDLLRKRWGFKGFVVSDYTAVDELIQHGIAGNQKEASYLAFKAGLDMDMVDEAYLKQLPVLVKEGRISKKTIDVSVRRILEAKYKLGLFSDPYRGVSEEVAKKVMMSKEKLAHAREISRRSIVLLKNEKNLLPLKRSGTLALIGPMVENRRDQIGNWSAAGDPKRVVSLLEGVNNLAQDKVQIISAKGANIIDDHALVDKLNADMSAVTLDEKSPEKLLEDAIKIAKKADVVVLALGEPQSFTGEAASRTKLRLPENQQNLLRAIKETGKPIVLLLNNGRPLVLDLENQLSDAIVETWFLGTESGNAIADILFGDYNPSGKITMSFPATEGQIPIYYAAKNTGRPLQPIKYSSKYLDASNEPLFPFGFGLSYTHFTISEPKLSAEKIKATQTLKVTVEVENTGMYDGEETVQLYVRDLVSSVTRPVKELRGFQKVFLRKGEHKQVELELNHEDLKFYDKNNKWISESGEFRVMVGGNSRDVKAATFTLFK